MLYAKLFVAAGILLLAEGTPGPQFKPRRGFIAQEEKPIDFKDMIIKKLLLKLNEALRTRGQPFQQLPQTQLITQSPQQIISQQSILPPQQSIIQQHIPRKPVIQQQIPQRSQVQQIPPQQLLQQPQQGRALLSAKNSQQFLHNCEFQQQPFGNDGAFQYEFEEAPCPCCQCGGAFEEITCPFCQGIQYEDIPCPCCDRQEQRQQLEEGSFVQRPLPFAEIQSPCNQNRPQFPPSIHPNQVASSGLQGTHMVSGRPIFKETFVSPISSCDIKSSEAKVFNEEPNDPKIKCPLSQAPLPQLVPPVQRIPELHQHCPQNSPQTVKAITNQLSAQTKAQRPQSQSSPLFIVPERVQVQTFVPHALHSSFFTGFSPEDEAQPGERIVHEGQFMSPKFKEILQASSRDAC